MSDSRSAILGRIAKTLGHDTSAAAPVVTQRVHEHARGPQPQWTEDPRARFLAKLEKVVGTWAEVAAPENIVPAVADYLASQQLPQRLCNVKLLRISERDQYRSPALPETQPFLRASLSLEKAVCQKQLRCRFRQGSRFGRTDRPIGASARKSTPRKRVFKKSAASELRSVPEKRQFIADHRDLIKTVTRGWELMKRPRSSYYYHSKSQGLSLEDQALGNRIEEITEEFPKYGYRKVTRELHRKDIPVNHKKVHRIMREKGLLVTKTQQFVKTTDSNHPYPVYPNLIQTLQVTNLNQVWVADITFIRIAVGFVYLAVILDLCSRKAIGYAISRTIDTSLSLSALRMAIQSPRWPSRSGSAAWA